ncbi:HD domain-containing protein [Sulfurospirillum diekertiae]|jgi:putative hydrolase of HD superfamily|uniref:HD domain-containing protein n=1 Tax=Sulfurospirillum diekertiae TaxID=1854492 RepID=A0A290HA96_9BACT|nr:HD domain-containing protein [Sulfurospirillum diekertiae]ATB68141.1 putative HD superfamily hydrolase [Sulfurospirillum diekertiae]QIR76032.1 HD domain-containing protein [Sulfurospirillum diekertiae]QIR78673.1 HD domain-containing protein [Sulfurospirillum diekertiae]
MLSPKLIEQFFGAASIQRWNDYPRMVELVELDKQAHKFIIAYLIAKMEPKESINMRSLIEAGIFEFLRRVVVTDIRPDVFRKALQKKEKEINTWVLEQLYDSLSDIEEGAFYERFKTYLNDSSMYKKERFILKAASYMATRWEFSIVYQTSQFLNNIDRVKEAVEEEIEDYYELISVRKMAMNKKISKIVDLSGRLRFQKRWAQTPRIPETSVLGHMLIVAILGYFYSLSAKACDGRLVNNFFCALFHDFPEALTRDIISPVKYSVSGLDDIISEFEIKMIEEEILPYLPEGLTKEFKYLLGLYGDNQKDEFMNRINEHEIKMVEDVSAYNEEKYNAIDGKALKNCDNLAAFIEATLSISHGVRSKELIQGKEHIRGKLKEKGKIGNVDFYELALEIETYLGV